jgi:hypothetical protein
MNKSSKEYKVLVNWMKEFFPYSEFKKAGIFTKEMRDNYEAQAEHICRLLGLQSIYEYGKEEIRCHITYVNPDCRLGIDTNGRPLKIDKDGNLKPEPFVTIIPSIWDEEKKDNDLPFIDASKYDEDDEEPDDGDAFSPVLTRPPSVYL